MVRDTFTLPGCCWGKCNFFRNDTLYTDLLPYLPVEGGGWGGRGWEMRAGGSNTGGSEHQPRSDRSSRAVTIDTKHRPILFFLKLAKLLQQIKMIHGACFSTICSKQTESEALSRDFKALLEASENNWEYCCGRMASGHREETQQAHVGALSPTPEPATTPHHITTPRVGVALW